MGDGNRIPAGVVVIAIIIVADALLHGFWLIHFK